MDIRKTTFLGISLDGFRRLNKEVPVKRETLSVRKIFLYPPKPRTKNRHCNGDAEYSLKGGYQNIYHWTQAGKYNALEGAGR